LQTNIKSLTDSTHTLYSNKQQQVSENISCVLLTWQKRKQKRASVENYDLSGFHRTVRRICW